MNLAGRISPSNSHGRDMLAVEDPSSRKQTRHRTDRVIEIAENILSDEAVRGLLDEWIVPAIVERLVRDLMNTTLEKER